MNDDNSYIILPVIILLMFSFLIGFIVGTEMQDGNTRKETTISCIERPNDCKVRYDYYQLEQVK
jgi:hypothetical protein